MMDKNRRCGHAHDGYEQKAEIAGVYITVENQRYTILRSHAIAIAADIGTALARFVPDAEQHVFERQEVDDLDVVWIEGVARVDDVHDHALAPHLRCHVLYACPHHFAQLSV